MSIARARRDRGDRSGAMEILRERISHHDETNRDVLRLTLELAMSEGNGEAAALVALRLIDRRETGLRAEIIRAAEEALRSERPALAGLLLSSLPAEESERALRIAVSVALGQHDEAERWLSRPSAQVSASCDAAAWASLGRLDMAIEVLHTELDQGSAAHDSASPLRLDLAEFLWARGQAGDRSEAATLLHEFPIGTSAEPRLRSLLGLVLHDGGDAMLAERLVSAPSALRSNLRACGLPLPPR